MSAIDDLIAFARGLRFTPATSPPALHSWSGGVLVLTLYPAPMNGCWWQQKE